MIPTPRQIEVLDAVIAHDGDRRAAAAALFVSRNTVKSHLHNLYARLDIEADGHRSLLIAAARRLGRLSESGG